jgi:hypothetical protein
MQAIIKELYGLNIKQNLTIKQLEARFQQEQEEQRALKVKSNILQIKTFILEVLKHTTYQNKISIGIQIKIH